MTKEEAINKWIIPAIRDIWNDKKCDEIIKALDQGLCDDTISRQAAIDAICKACSVDDDYYECDGYPKTSTWCDELVALRALPSATPQPKTGHWIIEKWNNKEHYSCSSCQHVVDYEPCYHYCPYCGAKMEEELQWFDIA